MPWRWGDTRHMPGKKESHMYRNDHKHLFIKYESGLYGGYRRGVDNGPAPSTARGKRRRNAA